MRQVEHHGSMAGARFVDPKTLARIGSLELLARTVVEGFINGLHKSPYLGVSIDFAEHRGYVPGDDIRRVDWRLYARTDRYYVKQFEADTNTNFAVLLDVSRSMSFTSGGLSKLDYARYLAACLTYFASQQRDRVGLVTFDNQIVDYVPPSAKHVEAVLHRLDRATAGRPGSLREPLHKMAEHFGRRGILLVISDLYEDPDAVLDAIKPLRFRGNDMIVFHVLDPAEIEFPYTEASAFQDLETDEKVPVVPETFAEQYRALVKEHIAALSSRLKDNRVDYALFSTSEPLDIALFRYLSARQKLHRVR
jgi:uncharacterized protein (DUF58 family)